jgi:hypothetical protein
MSDTLPPLHPHNGQPTLDCFSLYEMIRIQLVSKTMNSNLDLSEFEDDIQTIANRLNDKFNIHPQVFM